MSDVVFDARGVTWQKGAHVASLIFFGTLTFIGNFFFFFLWFRALSVCSKSN